MGGGDGGERGPGGRATQHSPCWGVEGEDILGHRCQHLRLGVYSSNKRLALQPLCLITETDSYRGKPVGLWCSNSRQERTGTVGSVSVLFIPSQRGPASHASCLPLPVV